MTQGNEGFSGICHTGFAVVVLRIVDDKCRWAGFEDFVVSYVGI